MTANIREAGPPLVQGDEEIIAYQVTTTPWGSSPGTISCAVFDITAGTRNDVTTTVINGTPSFSGTDLTMWIKAGTDAELYNVRIRLVTTAGEQLEDDFELHVKDIG